MKISRQKLKPNLLLLFKPWYQIFGDETSRKLQKTFSDNCVCTDNSWVLHHDNAPWHTALILCEFFAKFSTKIVPPYSFHLASCDFWLLRKLKRPLWGNRFESIEDIKRESWNYKQSPTIFCSQESTSFAKYWKFVQNSIYSK